MRTILGGLLAIALLGGSSLRSVPALGKTDRPKNPKSFSFYDQQVNEILSKMTLEEKIGQMTQAEQDSIKDIHDVDKYHLGSVFCGGNSDPKEGNSLEAWTDMYDRFQAEAVKTRLGIPILFGVDAVHGHNNVLNAVIFPQNVAMGCTRDAALVEKAARITAEEVRATGINFAFAPCVAVPRDIRWGRSYEGYGEDPQLARKLGEAAVKGFQGTDLANPLSVLACAKHFVGDGGTSWGTGLPKAPDTARWGLDQGDTKLSEDDLKRLTCRGT